MADIQERRTFPLEEQTQETAATITAALLSRLPLPADRDEAADYAVGLYWRVERGLVSQAPEQMRPEQPEFRVQEKQQP